YLLPAALFLWLGARWVKAPAATYRRALIVAAAVLATSLLALPAADLIEGFRQPDNDSTIIAAQAGAAIVLVILSFLEIRLLLRTSTERAIGVWLVGLIPVAAAAALGWWVIVPRVATTFVVPNNAMAPTLAGWHMVGVCPHCQGALLAPATSPNDRTQPPRERNPVGIC